MPQIKSGLASVETGTNRVIGNAAADWSEVVPGYSMFGLLPEAGNTAIVVQTKTAPGASLSGNWEMTLAANYDGATVVDSLYIIHKDFSPNKNFPLFTFGDHFMTQILNRFILMQDVEAPPISGGGLGGILTDFTIATLDEPKPSLWWKIVVEEGHAILQWWLLQVGAPDPGDVATSDDSTSRWRRVG